MQALATSAHRGFQRLVGTGSVAVERDGETVDDEAGHGELVWIKVGHSSDNMRQVGGMESRTYIWNDDMPR